MIKSAKTPRIADPLDPSYLAGLRGIFLEAYAGYVHWRFVAETFPSFREEDRIFCKLAPRETEEIQTLINTPGFDMFRMIFYSHVVNYNTIMVARLFDKDYRTVSFFHLFWTVWTIAQQSCANKWLLTEIHEKWRDILGIETDKKEGGRIVYWSILEPFFENRNRYLAHAEHGKTGTMIPWKNYDRVWDAWEDMLRTWYRLAWISDFEKDFPPGARKIIEKRVTYQAAETLKRMRQYPVLAAEWNKANQAL